SLSVKEAAAVLGVAPRTMYSLAAPAGPLPCYRIGRRVIFEHADLLEYKAQCRSTVIRSEVASSLSLTVASTAHESGLESAFRRLGIKLGRTSSTGSNA